MVFRLEPVDIGTDLDGDPITSCTVSGAEPPSNEFKRTKLSKNQSSMLELVGGAGQEGMSQSVWFEQARKIGIGAKRNADCYDISKALKRKTLVYNHAEKWHVHG